MTSLVTKGGAIVWLILACSIFALASFIEKLVVIHRSRINTDKFLAEIEILVRQNKVKEAERLCDRFNTPVTRVVRAGIANLSATRERITNCMEEVALLELPKLEERLGILATVAHIAPLLGLLGTVVGMIRAFQVIQTKTQAMSFVSPADLAEGIWVALITTACGLSVAIPTVVAYNYIRHYVKVIQHDMERAASRVLALA
ncbi:MAG: MotA/TolQ/ExbB proton channel family protein [Candidatus Omnitrophica bacterium]|nr:MotA/TolQ/ExbB proton channel family protein [Candidatus Omnitrophota bacterium]